jgi:Fis family transcriptional regulator, factor for inversion stimulation protein
MKTKKINLEDKKVSPLRKSVEASLQDYFKELGSYEDEACHIYKMVFEEVEQALLNFILKHTAGNQSKAASLLGISRGTLRKKLKQHQINCYH